MSSPELLGFPRLRFFTSDFCPFAQRARIALEWFKMPFELIEALSLPEGAGQYKKHPLLVEKNPKGLIPTLLVDWPDGHEEVVTDSLLVVEYIDGLAARFKMTQAPLVPRDDKLERDRILAKASFYNENIASPFYAILMRGDKAAFNRMVKGSEEFLSEMRGPFYNGSTMCIVDIAVYPWILRAFLLGYYKGAAFTISQEDQPQLSGFFEWYERMSAEVEAVKATLMPRDYYIKAYERYASGEASSQVGRAVMRGEPAHIV